MKITDVKPFPVWVGHRNQLLVKVETDSGIYGWGESGLSGRELAVSGAVEHYRNWLIGKDPMKRGALWQEMYRSQYFEGGRVLTAAISAIDIALYDIAGKALGVPVYELLGGKHRDNVHTFGTTRARPGPEMIEQAQALVDAGWNCMRLSSDQMGIGDTNLYEPRESIANTAEWFIKTREALGLGPVLGVDYHHRLSVAEAASFLQMLPSHTLDFIEEPIRDESPEAYEALRKMTPVPFAIGEEFSSKWQFLPYIERGITNYARLDLCNVGGFTEAMKVAGWAEAHYIDLMPHNPLGPICTIATVHFAASIPNFAWLETWRSPWAADRHDDDRIFRTDMQFKNARFIVPDAPGLGIDVNEDGLKEPFRPWEAPHLRRNDGSYTNW
jgi:galactonate dehydratase